MAPINADDRHALLSAQAEAELAAERKRLSEIQRTSVTVVIGGPDESRQLAAAHRLLQRETAVHPEESYLLRSWRRERRMRPVGEGLD